MTELTASDLVVRRGGRAILDRLSLRAGSGEFIAVVGANGAGKSTLLAVLAGLINPDMGSVTLDAVPLQGLPAQALARRRAYLPQNPRCEWPISVERLVALGLIPNLPPFARLSSADEERISRALEVCDLAQRRHQPATSLSGGELARAMLARAFVGDPDIVMVDEPVAGLDPRHVIEIAQRLLRFAREGKLVIASLHDLTLAARYATRVVALRQGRLVCDGPVADLLTPDFIRTVFEVNGRIVREDNSVYVDYTGL